MYIYIYVSWTFPRDITFSVPYKTNENFAQNRAQFVRSLSCRIFSHLSMVIFNIANEVRNNNFLLTFSETSLVYKNIYSIHTIYPFTKNNSKLRNAVSCRICSKQMSGFINVYLWHKHIASYVNEMLGIFKYCTELEKYYIQIHRRILYIWIIYQSDLHQRFICQIFAKFAKKVAEKERRMNINAFMFKI